MDELSDQEIKMFLEQVPLYTSKTYKLPKINRSDLYVREIECYCSHCNQSRPFQDMSSRGSGLAPGQTRESLKNGISYFDFKCVSCKTTKIIQVERTISKENIVLMKFGELPRKDLERDAILQKFFSDDSDNYEKATVCLANGYGIAAFVYYRRIIEHNIDKLLDLIKDDIGTTDQHSDLLKSISLLREESPMSEKISIANKSLPDYLIPDGLNPLGRLYQILSEGIHSLSDQECLERSNIVKECIKFLISELTSRTSHRKQFKHLVGKL